MHIVVVVLLSSYHQGTWANLRTERPFSHYFPLYVSSCQPSVFAMPDELTRYKTLIYQLFVYVVKSAQNSVDFTSVNNVWPLFKRIAHQSCQMHELRWWVTHSEFTSAHGHELKPCELRWEWAQMRMSSDVVGGKWHELWECSWARIPFLPPLPPPKCGTVCTLYTVAH